MKALVKMGPIVAICAFALFLSASNASAVIFDHFTDDITDLEVSSASVNAYDCQTGLAGVIGGSRKLNLHWAAGDVGPKSQVTITTSGADHFFDFSNPTDGTAWSTHYHMLYDNDATPLTNDGDENGNFDISGDQYLTIGLLGSDTVTTAHWILTDQDSSDTVDQPIPLVVYITPTEVQTPFALFSGIDFSDLKSIELVWDGPNVGDYRVDYIGSGIVPEPLTMLGLFMGLGGVGAYIRKRRMA